MLDSLNKLAPRHNIEQFIRNAVDHGLNAYVHSWLSLQIPPFTSESTTKANHPADTLWQTGARDQAAPCSRRLDPFSLHRDAPSSRGAGEGRHTRTPTLPSFPGGSRGARTPAFAWPLPFTSARRGRGFWAAAPQGGGDEPGLARSAAALPSALREGNRGCGTAAGTAEPGR